MNAFITGATGGIGSALAARLAREGFNLFLFGHDDEATVALFWSLSDQVSVFPYTGDICNESNVSEAAQLAVKKFGAIDLLVTCHGAPPCIVPSEELTRERFMALQDVDLWGTFNVCQKVGRQMLAQGAGCIVALASMHSVATYPKRAAYAAARTGIAGLARVLAIEWGGRGVRVNALSPWQVRGARHAAIFGNDSSERDELMLRHSPMRRFVMNDDVAEAVLFLWRDKGMNGQNVILDGGVTASMWYEPFMQTGETSGFDLPIPAP